MALGLCAWFGILFHQRSGVFGVLPGVWDGRGVAVYQEVLAEGYDVGGDPVDEEPGWETIESQEASEDEGEKAHELFLLGVGALEHDLL